MRLISEFNHIFQYSFGTMRLQAAREVVLSDYHNTMLAAGDAAEDEVRHLTCVQVFG